jgi:hypothetical protein
MIATEFGFAVPNFIANQGFGRSAQPPLTVTSRSK